jgi:hypothetical protein
MQSTALIRDCSQRLPLRPGRSSLLGVPILTSATKSLISRWTSPVSTMIDADLTDHEELAAPVDSNLVSDCGMFGSCMAHGRIAWAT